MDEIDRRGDGDEVDTHGDVDEIAQVVVGESKDGVRSTVHIHLHTHIPPYESWL